MWRKELRFDFENDIEVEEESPLSRISGFRYFSAKVIVTYQITDGHDFECKRVLSFHGKAESYLKAARNAFQAFIDKKIYSNEVQIESTSYCGVSYKDLPFVLKIDHLHPSMQDLIKQLLHGFVGTETELKIKTLIQNGIS